MIRTATWSKVGKSVEGCKDMEQVLWESGLDYTVEMKPVYVRDQKGFYKEMPNRFVTTRKGHPKFMILTDMGKAVAKKLGLH